MRRRRRSRRNRRFRRHFRQGSTTPITQRVADINQPGGFIRGAFTGRRGSRGTPIFSATPKKIPFTIKTPPLPTETTPRFIGGGSSPLVGDFPRRGPSTIAPVITKDLTPEKQAQILGEAVGRGGISKKELNFLVLQLKKQQEETKRLEQERILREQEKQKFLTSEGQRTNVTQPLGNLSAIPTKDKSFLGGFSPTGQVLEAFTGRKQTAKGTFEGRELTIGERIGAGASGALAVVPVPGGVAGKAGIEGLEAAAKPALSKINPIQTIKWALFESKAGGIIRNPKNTKLIGKLMAAAGVGIITINFTKDVITDMIFSGFIGVEEALQMVGFTSSQAIKTGNQTLIDEAFASEQEVLDFADELKDKLPWEKSIAAINFFRKKGQDTLDLKKKIQENQKIAEANGEDDKAYWERINKQKFEQEKFLIDDYNKQRKLQIQWEEEARAAEREEEARFWANERAKQRRNEAADRQKQANFWFEYRKKVMELNQTGSAQRSNLGFGLL